MRAYCECHNSCLADDAHVSNHHDMLTWYTQAHGAPRWKPQTTARPAVSGAHTSSQVGTATRVPPRQGSSTECCAVTQVMCFCRSCVSSSTVRRLQKAFNSAPM